jgi:subtilase family serine protease
MTAGGSTPAAAQMSTDRIAQKIQSDQVEAIPGTSHPLALPEYDQGRVSGSMALRHVSIVFRLSPAQQEDLDQLLAEQQDPSSANYHKWLTPDQYADRFGLTRNDAAKVVSWLKSQGLTAESVSRGRTEIFFSGNAAQIEAALHTELHHYVVNGETHFANASEPSVPSAFAGVVLGFRNLDDFRPKSRMRAVSPHFTSNQTGNHFLVPDDFATIYDLKPLYNSGLDGTGVTIGVVGDSAISLSDIDSFRANSNLAPNDPTVIIVPGTGTPAHNGDEVEADLDLEWSGGVAKNANIIYYVSGDGNAFDALHYAINPGQGQTLAPVISNSFGNCESNLGLANAQTIRGWIQQANSQGQTVTSAAGDAGAADCEGQTSTIATTGLQVDLPAAVPEVTAVGGTEFTGDAPSLTDTQYWFGANNGSNGSARSYIPEMTWNDGPSPGTGLSATIAAGGGGKSTFFTKAEAPWQTGVTPNDGQRDVPDISLNASNTHDSYLLCSQAFFAGVTPPLTSCVTTSQPFRASDGKSLAAVGGTSAGAPTMAGILAIINQATKSCGLSNVNGSKTVPGVGLYAMATAHPTAFHDIAPPPVSSNIVPCQPGSTSCPKSSPFQFGFNTTTGYDLATGLGSIDAHLLTTNWPSYNPGQTVNTSAAVVSSSPTANAGVTVTFTATISTSGKACPCSSPRTAAIWEARSRSRMALPLSKPVHWPSVRTRLLPNIWATLII